MDRGRVRIAPAIESKKDVGDDHDGNGHYEVLNWRLLVIERWRLFFDMLEFGFRCIFPRGGKPALNPSFSVLVYLISPSDQRYMGFKMIPAHYSR
jgi:hypothetical protein